MYVLSRLVSYVRVGKGRRQHMSKLHNMQMQGVRGVCVEVLWSVWANPTYGVYRLYIIVTIIVVKFKVHYIIIMFSAEICVSS